VTEKVVLKMEGLLTKLTFKNDMLIDQIKNTKQVTKHSVDTPANIPAETEEEKTVVRGNVFTDISSGAMSNQSGKA